MNPLIGKYKVYVPYLNFQKNNSFYLKDKKMILTKKKNTKFNVLFHEIIMIPFFK